MADTAINRMRPIGKAFAEKALPYSYAPHAPYSISEALLEQIYDSPDGLRTTSLHFMETQGELEVFEKGSGPFYTFYDALNIPYFINQRKHKKEIDFILHGFNSDSRLLTIHNTLANAENIQELARRLDENWFMCACPQANLYIENRLPEYSTWMDIVPQQICIGTDSLGSNTGLSIFDEILTIQSHSPDINADTLLQWANINGARALGIDHLFGSFVPGKTPGAVLLSMPVHQKFIPGKPQRII
jgi:cytosine/adenosine deaminase-related metal-dependent hydrolase